MNRNLMIFVELCQEKNVPLRIIHECGNLLEVTARDGKTYLFTIGSTPFNNQSVASLCKDKEFFYNYYQDVVSMPRKKGFLNPDCEPQYREYLVFSTYAQIIQESKRLFSYPLIAKMNQGEQGRCVFKITNDTEFEQALTQIYQNDYIALVQEYINIQSEYRVIYLNKRQMFAYKKNNENAVFTGNLSPLHYDGAFAQIVEDKDLKAAFDQFIAPVFEKQNIPYCGMDIAVDKNGKMWLIEGNTTPGFSHLLKIAKGPALVKELYTQMFKYLDIIK